MKELNRQYVATWRRTTRQLPLLTNNQLGIDNSLLSCRVMFSYSSMYHFPLCFPPLCTSSPFLEMLPSITLLYFLAPSSSTAIFHIGLQLPFSFLLPLSSTLLVPCSAAILSHMCAFLYVFVYIYVCLFL